LGRVERVLQEEPDHIGPCHLEPRGAHLVGALVDSLDQLIRKPKGKLLRGFGMRHVGSLGFNG
jgi:hypothetical protein